MYVGRVLIGAHGVPFPWLTFSQILDEIIAFLHDNPSETILMSVKKEWGTTLNSDVYFRELLDEVINQKGFDRFWFPKFGLC